MRASLPHLSQYGFPALRRGRLETLQVNVGYRCNQSCLHCHVNAGPTRKEQMSAETADVILAFLAASGVSTLDITGGAPELNANFRRLVSTATSQGIQVMDRCNLTILEEPGQEDLAEYLAEHGVHVVASLPCYLEENVDRQRGKGVFQMSIKGLRRLNALGYGKIGSGLRLDLVYNPQGPVLPPPQEPLQAAYKEQLNERFGVEFNQLLTLANLPVGRFGSTLLSHGEFNDYVALLHGAHNEPNLASVMCRSLVSVDWQGYLFDCDFNQMLDLPLRLNGYPKLHLSDVVHTDLEGQPIVVRDHCYGCTAGQGSSCGGALG